jgi:hypothetical protein
MNAGGKTFGIEFSYHDSTAREIWHLATFDKGMKDPAVELIGS